MITILTLFRVQLQSLRNALRSDTRMRLIALFLLLFDLSISFWSGSELRAHLLIWSAEGQSVLSHGLTSLVSVICGSMGLLALIESFQQQFASDEALLLFMQPMPPGLRFRAISALFFLRNLWNWLLLETSVTGLVLITTLGWNGLLWLTVLQCGVIVSIIVSLILSWLLMRYALPHLRLLMTVLLSLLTLTIVLMLASSGILPSSVPRLTISLPEITVSGMLFVSVLFLLILLALFGPLASVCGRLYYAAFLTVQNRDSSRSVVLLPGIQPLSHLLSRYRNPYAALLVKGLLCQSRNPVFWLRLLLTIAGLCFLPQIRLLVPAGFDNTLFVLCASVLLTLLPVFEQASSIISGEGNRISLYLTSALRPQTLLLAKLLVPLSIVLSADIVLNLSLAVRFSLSWTSMLFTLVASMLIIISCLTLAIWGGSRDLDIEQAVEGFAQSVLLEEGPFSPRKMGLLNLTLFVVVGSILLIWKLPAALALPVMVSLTVIIVYMSYRYSLHYLRSMLQ